MESVRIIDLPDCKMISSGIGNFGEGIFKIFEEYFTSLPHATAIFPHDFLFVNMEIMEVLVLIVYTQLIE
jgi:AraC family transcriptional regulator